MARLHLHSFGDDLASVLLLHGLASAGPVWWRVAGALADAGHSSLAPDLRGHGESAHTDDYTLEGYARDVIESCRGPWDLVIGHSLGGAVAVRTATIDPGFARSFLLVDPAIDIDADAARQLRTDLVEQATSPPSVDQLVADFPKWHRGDCERKRAALLATSPEVMEASLDDNPNWHLGDELAALGARVHILGAGTDPLYTAADFERHRSASSHLSFEVVPDTGHSIYRDNAQTVIELALALLG